MLYGKRQTPDINGGAKLHPELTRKPNRVMVSTKTQNQPATQRKGYF
jgi:hypothetical protein